MTNIDEKLSTYLDGELSVEEAAEFGRIIDSDPKLKKNLESLKEADETIRNAYSAIDGAPMPYSVMALLGDESDKDDGKPSASVIPFLKKITRMPHAPAWSTPLAASIALLVGIGLGYGLVPNLSRGDALQFAGLIDASDPLFTVIDSGVSGDSVTIGRTQVTPILSFRSVEGAYCREFSGKNEVVGIHAVACREEAVWRVKIAVADSPILSSGSFSPAAGANSALEDYIDSLIDGDVLAPDVESRLLERGWGK